MRYFQDDKGVDYFLYNSGRYVYEDRIKEPKVVLAKRKKAMSTPNQVGTSSSGPSPSADSLFSSSSKAYFDEWFINILVDSHAREFPIHAHIDG